MVCDFFGYDTKTEVPFGIEGNFRKTSDLEGLLVLRPSLLFACVC